MNYKYTTYILTCILIILCIIWWKKTPVTTPQTKPPIPALKISDIYWKNNVILSSGVSITDETIVVNTLTGEKVKPCKGGSFIVAEENGYKNKQSEDGDCSVLAVNPDPKLRAAIDASKSIIEGEVIKDGKKVPANFVVSITANYHSSICSTIQNGNNQYSICLEETDFCRQMYQNRFNGAKWWAENIGPPMSDGEIQKQVLKNLPDYCTDIINNN